jgi:hypothetical protein
MLLDAAETSRLKGTDLMVHHLAGIFAAPAPEKGPALRLTGMLRTHG